MRGQYGYCVLNCEEFTPKNDTSRVCSCYLDVEGPALISTTVQPCPSNAASYPYGCFCNQSTTQFFDRFLTHSCVTTCPPSTYAANGLCMSCPPQCDTCQIDQLFRAYLECKICKTGFTLTGGQCYASCSPGSGFSIVNKTCQSCSDPNCINCSSDVSICTRCSVLYSLSNGVCLRTCQLIQRPARMGQKPPPIKN